MDEFIDVVVDDYNDLLVEDKYNDINIIAKFPEMKEIVEELISYGFEVNSINMANYDRTDDIDKEYILGIFENKIWVEPAKNRYGYLNVEANIVYLMDNCNSKIISKIHSDEVYEISIGEDDCAECKECTYNKCSNTCYKVNSEEVTKAEYDKAVDEFYNKYMDGIANMLLDYSELINKLNELF